MTRIAVQRGHIPGEGATGETATVALIEPYLVNKLVKAGLDVQRFGADIPYGQTHDLAIFLHCDSDGASSFWTMGYWEDMHPGSQKYVGYIEEAYGKICPWRHGDDNYTGGEHYYYANRRFIPPTKCALIEMGFVSNPRDKAYMQEHPSLFGEAIARGILKYLGKEETELSVSSSRYGKASRLTLLEGHAHIGKNGNLTEGCWLLITNFSAPIAAVQVMVVSDTMAKSQTYKVALNKTQVVNLEGFGITGTVTYRVSSDVEVVADADHRVWS
jgi:hypothetical protein